MTHPAYTLDPDAIYERQWNLGLYIPTSATVIGLGGTGSWVALQLAMLGVSELTLIDDDLVELHNLNRLPLPPSAIGTPKVEAIAAEIARLRPNILVIPIQKRWDGEDDVLGTYTFDCTDHNAVQRKIKAACDENDISYYVRAGCGANEITATRRLPGWGDDGDGGYGAQGVPIWIGPAVLAATRSVGIMAHGWPEVSGNIRQIDREDRDGRT